MIQSLVVAAVALGLAAHAAVKVEEKQAFTGMADASAVVPLGGEYFVVADDESNVLRIYSLEKGGPPVETVSLGKFLQVDRKNPEADVEGGARDGDLIYWITSHARSKSGKERSSRQRFFATRIVPGAVPKTEVHGHAYGKLIRDLAADPGLKKYKLQEGSLLEPKAPGGLNIEGLAKGPNGSALIAFRNPVLAGKALIVPLLNPRELVETRNAKAKFGAPIEIDLEGKGCRDIVEVDGSYYIIAGNYDSGGASELYKWDGKSGSASLLYRWPGKKFNAEAVTILPGGSNELLILSDEGSKKQAGVENKDLPQEQRRFHAVRLSLDPAAD